MKLRWPKTKIKITIEGWYKWERLRARGRSTKFHCLARVKTTRGFPGIGWTSCGELIPKPEDCKRLTGPVFGGRQQPCQNCIRAIAKKSKAAGTTG